MISRPPVWGGKVLAVDDSLALNVPGVERVVRIPETPVPIAFFPLGGVAVIAKNTWAAIRGRNALRITWDNGPNATYDSTAYKAALMKADGTGGRPSGRGQREGGGVGINAVPAGRTQYDRAVSQGGQAAFLSREVGAPVRVRQLPVAKQLAGWQTRAADGVRGGE